MAIFNSKQIGEIVNTYNPNINFRSKFGRNYRLDSELQKKLELIDSNPNILYIGVGKSEYDSNMAGPGFLELSSMLDIAGKKSYNMTILDRDEEVVKIASNTESVIVSDYYVNNDLIRPLWESYLSTTEGLVKKVEMSNKYGNFDESVLIAEAPKAFKRAKRNDMVNFSKGDIITLDPKSIKPFDVIYCTNVLRHTRSNNAFLLGLRNIGDMMQNNGILYVDSEFYIENGEKNADVREAIKNNPLFSDLSIQSETVCEDPYKRYDLLLVTKK